MLSKNQLKEIQSLQLKKQRDLKKLFIAEGVKTVVEILTHIPGSIHHVYGTRVFASTHKDLLEKTNTNFTEISEEELVKISLQANPNQVFAVCNYFPQATVSYNPSVDFSFYLDDIRDPGNLGTIIRLADWFGLKTIFCSPDTCDLYNPKVIQSTMGSFLRVNVVYTELNKLVASLKIKTIYGAVLEGKNIYHEKLEPGLILIGNEANGIRPENMSRLTKHLTIPKHVQSGTESLNAAVATSIIASEFYRQLKA
ncbi:MAG: RNA methyltransferase [Bacteroidia bacterium]|nr:RNA methyltransferase [Bacteroidia bacterium]